MFIRSNGLTPGAETNVPRIAGPTTGQTKEVEHATTANSSTLSHLHSFSHSPFSLHLYTDTSHPVQFLSEQANGHHTDLVSPDHVGIASYARYFYLVIRNKCNFLLFITCHQACLF